MNGNGLRLHCDNCGTDFTPPPPPAGEPLAAGYTCPVCQFYISTTAPTAERQVSVGDLETQLDMLLSEARTSGVTPDEIIRVLRDELEFHAELGHAGRRLVVQIIDLGPQAMERLTPTEPDHRNLLNGRGLTN